MINEFETKIKQVIVIRSDLKMNRGKEIAQGSHASMSFLTQQLHTNNTISLSEVEKEWLKDFRKICVRVHSEQELLDLVSKAKEQQIAAHLVQDSGLTYFNNVPTYTCAAFGPDYDEKLDKLTGHLKLY